MQAERFVRLFWKVVLFLVIGSFGCWLYSELSFGLAPPPSRSFTNIPK